MIGNVEKIFYRNLRMCVIIEFLKINIILAKKAEKVFTVLTDDIIC